KASHEAHRARRHSARSIPCSPQSWSGLAVAHRSVFVSTQPVIRDPNQHQNRGIESDGALHSGALLFSELALLEPHTVLPVCANLGGCMNFKLKFRARPVVGNDS